VYRLVGAAENGDDVIAKRVPLDSIEPFMYSNVLPQLRVSTPRYFGAVKADGAHWIFMQDVGGSPYNWASADHRAAGGRWLGVMHTALAKAGAITTLPIRDEQYWLGLLDETARTAVAWSHDSRQSPDAVRAAVGIAESCGELRNRWSAVTNLCSTVPSTLIHGDFVPKNVRVLEVDGMTEAVPLDWGSAGSGIVPIDLAYIDARAYRNTLQLRSSGLSVEGALQLSSLGRIFRTLLLVSWMKAESDVSEDPEFTFKVTAYERWIRAELGQLRRVVL
jgi:aminoglycoside phosphotransferase (APT) family kinase protein